MRGTVAKRLRKEARKNARPTEYNWYEHPIKRIHKIWSGIGKFKTFTEVTVRSRQVMLTGYRETYKLLKTKYRKEASHGRQQ